MNKPSNSFIRITDHLSVSDFEIIKDFIIKKGDRKTYRNFDNHNPHYDFKEFEVFLGAVIGQRNINNDPAISDFNEMVFYDRTFQDQYLTIIIVRKGDLSNSEIKVRAKIKDGMQEEEVYLVERRNQGEAALDVNRAVNYINYIRKSIK